MRVAANARGLLDQASGGAAAARGDHQPLAAKPAVRVPHAIAFGTESLTLRHEDVVEAKDRMVIAEGVAECGRAHQLDPGLSLDR